MRVQAIAQRSTPEIEVKLYDLFLDLDFQALKFQGKLVVQLTTENDVTFDAVGLEVQRISANGKSLQFKFEKDSLVASTGRFSGILEIVYAGTVSDNMVGIYKAPYGDDYVISTQFEAAHARRLLPCIDRPSVKAEFKLSVKCDSKLSVISNMPSESVTQDGDRKLVKFQKTPRMSTYLLYLGVGKFSESPPTNHGSAQIIAATAAGSPTKIDTGFATKIADKSLTYYESYYNIPYVLPKLHLIGVPEFAHGAMENWGAITFREIALHADNETSVRGRKDVAITVAHEVAHMWFGNLVTMKWWDDLWLNESFATFVSFKAVDQILPSLKIWQDFPQSTAGAMARDGLRSTHPIEAKVKTVEEIESLIDEITYSKGSSVLRMIEAYISAESFRRGVAAYLNDHKYANASGHDLWDSLQRASDVEVSRVVKEWIGKPGFPVVTVSRTGKGILLEQERFVLTGERDTQTWPVPVTMRLNGEPRKILLDKSRDELSIPDLSSLKLNVDNTGFYRVHYKDDLQEMVWKDNVLSPFDRWGLINDSWAFLQAGKIGFADYQKLVRKYFDEQSYLPALEVSDELGLLHQISPETASLSREYHRSQLKILERGTDENSKMLRGIVAARLARVDDDYAKEVGSMFAEVKNVEPDMKRSVSIGFARSTNDFEAVLAKYRSARTDEDKETFEEALLSFTDPGVAALGLGLGFSGELKKQDIFNVPLFALPNPDARDLLRVWFKTNVEKLGKALEGTAYLSYLLRRVIPIIGIGRMEEMRAFLEEKKLDGAEAALERLSIYDRLARTIMG